jgi:hypothetical protein
LWYLLPLLVAATWTAGALRRVVLTAVFGGIVGACALAAGILAVCFIRTEIGPIASIGTGTAALACSVWLATTEERKRV